MKPNEKIKLSELSISDSQFIGIALFFGLLGLIAVFDKGIALGTAIGAVLTMIIIMIENRNQKQRGRR